MWRKQQFSNILKYFKSHDDRATEDTWHLRTESPSASRSHLHGTWAEHHGTFWIMRWTKKKRRRHRKKRSSENDRCAMFRFERMAHNGWAHWTYHTYVGWETAPLPSMEGARVWVWKWIRHGAVETLPGKRRSCGNPVCVLCQLRMLRMLRMLCVDSNFRWFGCWFSWVHIRFCQSGTSNLSLHMESPVKRWSTRTPSIQNIHTYPQHNPQHLYILKQTSRHKIWMDFVAVSYENCNASDVL